MKIDANFSDWQIVCRSSITPTEEIGKVQVQVTLKRMSNLKPQFVMRSITTFDLQYAHRFYGFHERLSISTATRES